MARRTPKVLYHYCSVPTFYNITRNRSIWLSDIGKSNDSQELKWIKGQCRYYILKAWTDYAKAVQENGELEKVDFDKFEQIQNQLEDLYKYETEKCWGFCLSEKKDDLGQWRGYADDGHGISIGFKSSYFKAIMRAGKTEITDPSSVAFDSICYNEKETEKLFYESCGLSLITPEMTSDDVIKRLRAAIVASLLLAPFYKNGKFAEEKEWRLVFSTLTKDLIAGKTPKTEFEAIFPDKEIQYDFIVRNNELVSHIAFADNKMASNISEIWIGPKCKMTTVDLKMYLISVGLLKDYYDNTIQIHKSQASYR